MKTGVQRLRKRGCAKTKIGCAVEVRRVWMEVCRVKKEGVQILRWGVHGAKVFRFKFPKTH